jgi:hypothetical protein
MPVKFIKWDKANDAAFRSAYNSTVANEDLGTEIRENSAETHYLIGSSRVSASEQTTLENDTNFDAVFSTDTEPVGWVDKTPPAP